MHLTIKHIHQIYQMPTHSKTRLLIVVSSAACFLGVLAALMVFMPSFGNEVVASRVAEVPNEWESKKDHPVVAPTDFYVALDDPEVEVNPQLKYSEHQVSLVSIIPIYILNDGDLLGDYCLLGNREFVTEQQVLEAQLLAKQYDPKLKEIRRQRAAVLEQAGVTLKDPEEELALIRIKVFCVYAEARRRIFNEILDAEQRKLIHQKHLAKQARARQIREEKQAAEKNKVSEQ